MKKNKFGIAAALLALLLTAPVTANAAYAERLVPVGKAVGIQMDMDGVMIAGFSEIETEGGAVSPGSEAGLMAGDIIFSFNERAISCAADFLTEASRLNGEQVSLTVRRQGKIIQFVIEPAKNDSGAYQLGLWLRDGVTGIGTITYFDPETGAFGALGHGISDAQAGGLVPICSAVIKSAEIIDVIKGGTGTPGELCGKISDNEIGSIVSNTNSGIFGFRTGSISDAAIPVAEESEISLGKASILANVSGSSVAEYDIEINRIYHNVGDCRTVMLTVTDPALISATGGIVQGMSGAPIIQNGKLIGAVTHVLVNDPTRGYGISIENMLQAAESTLQKAS